MIYRRVRWAAIYLGDSQHVRCINWRWRAPPVAHARSTLITRAAAITLPRRSIHGLWTAAIIYDLLSASGRYTDGSPCSKSKWRDHLTREERTQVLSDSRTRLSFIQRDRVSSFPSSTSKPLNKGWRRKNHDIRSLGNRIYKTFLILSPQSLRYHSVSLIFIIKKLLVISGGMWKQWSGIKWRVSGEGVSVCFSLSLSLPPPPSLPPSFLPSFLLLLLQPASFLSSLRAAVKGGDERVIRQTIIKDSHQVLRH